MLLSPVRGVPSFDPAEGRTQVLFGKDEVVVAEVSQDRCFQIEAIGETEKLLENEKSKNTK